MGGSEDNRRVARLAEHLRDPYRRRQVYAITRRSRQALFFAAATGVVTGLAVAAFEYVVREVTFESLHDRDLALRVAAPGIGLLLSAAALRWVAGRASPATADEYIDNYHDRGRPMDLRPLPGRIVAAFATLGSGGSLGYEGPSIYLGSGIGSELQRRLASFFSKDEAKMLLTAGAAAGVAAIFRAPATGVVFALEVPFRDDLARRQLVPAAVAAATSYLTFVALLGTERLLPVEGVPTFGFAELGGAVLLGALCGIGARFFSIVVRRAKQVAVDRSPFLLAAAAGVVLAGLALVADAAYGEPLTLGAGYDNVALAVLPDTARGTLLGLFALRAAAVVVTLGGRGVGGLFIPLVVQGALLGSLVGSAVGVEENTLFPLLGVAAFLSAGYRTPLAAVMFVAESTGRAGFVVPGLLASVVAQLMMGRWSVSASQTDSRLGHLERRFSMPLASALRADVLTIPPDATVNEFFWNFLIGARQQAVPVVDGARYLGTVHLADLSETPRDEWDAITVDQLMQTTVPVARPDWVLRQAVEAMEAAGMDLLPVVDDSGYFVGVTTFDDIVKLDEILDETEGRQ